jgi:hypothetical protein
MYPYVAQEITYTLLNTFPTVTFFSSKMGLFSESQAHRTRLKLEWYPGIENIVVVRSLQKVFICAHVNTPCVFAYKGTCVTCVCCKGNVYRHL